MDPKKIKSIRLKLGLSQKEFADLLEVHLTTVNRWEKGRYDTEDKTLKLLEALDTILNEVEKKNAKISIDDIKEIIKDIKEDRFSKKYSNILPEPFLSALSSSAITSLFAGILLTSLGFAKTDALNLISKDKKNKR